MFPITIKTDLTTPSTQIKPVTPATPVTAIPDLQSSSFEFEQGQKYQALIEARLLNGNSRVLVADKLLQMRLPENFQPGDQLELVFISHEPKLKFLVLNELPLNAKENNTTTGTASRPLGVLLQDTLKQAAATATQTGENNTTISTTGRFLGVLMQEASKQPSTNAPNTTTTHTTSAQSLTSSTPILAGPPTNSAELPGLLQKAITQSGLFYESHQAQWVNGENTLENLRQEPQGKLMLVTADPAAAKTAVATSAALGPEMPVHTQSIPLVQQQLSTLETGHLFWRGEVWQGQPMEWDIHEQPQGQKSESDHAAQWRTQLRLSMPQLGDITATIVLNAQGINIKLNTSHTETVSLLKNNQLPLTIDMQSAGLNVQSVEVQHNDRE